jgi:VIT1/CCC1 family predicted Fe2+/Mn2+ transporter
MAKDALAAHLRDELGISEVSTARPIQAALTSAATFAIGAALPLLVVIAPLAQLVPTVMGTSLLFFALLGMLLAYTGDARLGIGAVRVTFWGALAMALTAAIGWLFDVVV